MSVINLLGNDVWSEADIVNHGREVINSVVSVPRQDELRTIMLGHIAQMRTAAADELAEIALVQQITEQQVVDNVQASADNALLISVLAHEQSLQRLTKQTVADKVQAALDRLAQPPVDPIVELRPSIDEETGDETTVEFVVNGDEVAADLSERSASQSYLDSFNVTDEEGSVSSNVESAIAADNAERGAAQDAANNAAQVVLDLYALRNPPPPPPEVVDDGLLS